MQEKLRLHCAPVQIPIGLEDEHTGLIDLIKMKAFHFQGPNGEDIVEVWALLSVLDYTKLSAPRTNLIFSIFR
jgi:translation elongation factor EF-G